MNPSHREGWAPPQGGSQSNSSDAQGQSSRSLGSYGLPTSQQSPQAQPQGQTAAPVLPPPSGSFFSGQSSGPNLPHIAGLTQSSQTSPPQTAQTLPSMQTAPTETTPQRHPAESGEQERGQAITEQRDTENRRMEDVRMRDAEQHARETHEPHHLDAAQAQAQAQPQENHAVSVPLHQPVAVAPVRSIHGPNGILGGGAAPVNGPMSLNAQLPAPSGANVFPAGHVNQVEVAARAQPAPQIQPQAMVAGFAGPPSTQAAMAGQGQQPILNDALSYLDQVKVQFSERPDVYNKFLDIMKDFKSGQIDTPGVIDRVSNLFAGNPALIQGFNTFLPPGYKIECGTGDNPNAIRVTTPMGTTTSQLPSRPLSNPRPVALGVNGMSSDGPYDYGASRNSGSLWQSQAAPDASYSDRRDLSGSGYASGLQNSSAPLSPETQRQQQISGAQAALMHQQEQRGVSQLQNAASVAGSAQGLSSLAGGPIPSQEVNGLEGMMPQAGVLEKRGPVEFNHAINYVNKIKNRFASQPDIYKQFLEILQTYQRESKPIQEVYGQVTHLFQTAPDLLEDFKQFLPESAAHAKALAASREEQAMLSNMRGDPSYIAAMPQQMHTPRPDQSRMPPVGNFAPTPNAGRDNKRKRGERQPPVQSASAIAMPAAADGSGQGPRGPYGPGSGAKRQKQPHGVKPATAPELPPVSPTLVPALPMPLPPTTSVAPTPDEFHQFDRMKKHIGNKSANTEFLKLINMFIEGLIDKKDLIRRAHPYIGGNPELMTYFENFIGYKPQDEVIVNEARPASLGRVALAHCRSYGPSYRLLPKRETQAVCSGRDELCRAVLNDAWASHPIWGSEDSGFIAHRKNIHEEGLHRIEEERHDYDINIEACSRLIQLLEPIAQNLYVQGPEERAQFVLPEDLGGQSRTIYKRVIKKIYGRERGQMVIDQLFLQPYSVIPVILNRAKQRCEEWKAAQREWEKVWRQQTNNLYWRSLDHQSAGAKAADKRQFQTKTLQNEIQVKYQEQREKRERGIATDKYQFAWKIEDVDVLLDAARLVLTWVQSSHSAEMGTLEEFFKDFISTFFGIERARIDQALEMPDNSPELSDDAEGATPGASDSATRKVNGRGGNLHRAVLERGRTGKPFQADPDASIASGSRASTPGGSSAVEEDAPGAMEGVMDDQNSESLEKWLEHPTGGNLIGNRSVDPNEAFTRTSFHMYCNLPIYCFVRILLILYERLYALKKKELEVQDDVKRAMAHKPARDLGLIDKYPSDFFADTTPGANYYQQLIAMFEDVVRGEEDMSKVEEALRRYYLDGGWQLYSIDKLLASLARFAMALRNGETKDRTWDIWQAFRKDRARTETTYEDELNYRKKVEKDIKEGDMYRITFNQTDLKIYMRVFNKDDPTFNLSEFDEIQLWAAYVHSYTSSAPTENVRIDRVHIPFLKRQVPDEDDADDILDQLKSTEKMSVRISPDTFRPTFTPEQADWNLYTRSMAPDAEKEIRDAIAQESSEDDDKETEKLMMNSPWTKGLSTDEVDAVKRAFEQAVDSAATGNGMEVDGVAA